MQKIDQIQVYDIGIAAENIFNIMDFVKKQPMVSDAFMQKENLLIQIDSLKNQKIYNKSHFSILNNIHLEFEAAIQVFDHTKVPNGFSLKHSGYFLEFTMKPRKYKADNSEPLDIAHREFGIPGLIGSSNFNYKKDIEWIDGFDGENIRNDRYKATFFLNDDFCAGETTFPTKNLDISPKINKLLIHPCSRDYIYGVRPVVNGARFAIVAYYQLAKL
jgi:hypothetical protein